MSKKESSSYTCNVRLDSPSRVYFPDDLITGHVAVSTTNVISLHQCLLWCYGRTATAWRTYKPHNDVSSNRKGVSTFCGPNIFHYPSCAPIHRLDKSQLISGSSKVLFCYRLDLLSRSPPASEMKSSSLFSAITNSSSAGCSTSSAASLTFLGDRRLHFVFRLPLHLPSSFHLPESDACQAVISFGLHLQIRLSRSSASLAHQLRVDRAFLVNAPLDLALQPLLQDSVMLQRKFSVMDTTKQIYAPVSSMWEGKGGTPSPPYTGNLVVCDFALNKTGFVPGESILVTVSLKYGSSLPHIAAHISLIQRVSLHENEQHGSHVEYRRIFASLLSPLTSDGRSQASDGSNTEILGNFTEIIHVPPLPPSQSRGPDNPLIEIDYLVLLRLRLSKEQGGGKESQMSIPITIGTSPTIKTSFMDGIHVSPCLAWFDYSSGSILEQDSRKDSPNIRPVYRYCRPVVQLRTTPSSAANDSRPVSSLQNLCNTKPAFSSKNGSSNPLLCERRYFDDDSIDTDECPLGNGTGEVDSTSWFNESASLKDGELISSESSLDRISSTVM